MKTCAQCREPFKPKNGSAQRCTECRVANPRWKPPQPPRVADCTACGEEFEKSGSAKKCPGCRPKRGASPNVAVCTDCGVEFTRRVSHAKRCDECRLLRQSRCPPQIYVCDNCHQEFRRRKGTAKWCDDCRRQGFGTPVPEQHWTEPRVAQCLDCGEAFSYHKPGVQKRCDPCRLARGTRGRRRECANCGAEFRPVSNQQRCARCRSVTNSAKYVLGDRDGWTCGICGLPISPLLEHPHPFSWSKDHVLPVSLGGSDHIDNLQSAHLRCNVLKSNRIAEEDARGDAIS